MKMLEMGCNFRKEKPKETRSKERHNELAYSETKEVAFKFYSDW